MRLIFRFLENLSPLSKKAPATCFAGAFSGFIPLSIFYLFDEKPLDYQTDNQAVVVSRPLSIFDI
jgi:hypothetical protein